MDKMSLLRTVFVFSGLEESLLLKISALLKETKYEAGGTIFAQGQAADAFYIVDSGEVAITKKLGPGQEKVLAVLGAGSVFGEMAFFSDSPRTADAISRNSGVLLKIDRKDFVSFITEEPKAGLRIVSGLLQVTMDRLEQTSRELTTIYHTGNIITNAGRPAELLKKITDELLLAVPEALSAAAYFYNEYNSEFDPAAAPAGATELPTAHPLIAFLKRDQRGAVLNTPEEIKPLAHNVFSGAGSLLAVPIIKDSRMLGLILLWNTEKQNAFRSSHLLLAATVASQLAEAIENIRHRQDEQDKQRLNNAKQAY